VFIQENGDGTLQMLYDYHPTLIVTRRSKNNPDFPLKSVILCPHCKKPFLGSSPSGKSGKGFPTYHCARNHKYLGISKKEFELSISKFVSGLKFKDEFLDKLEQVLIKTWRKKQKKLLHDSREMHNNLSNLTSQKEKAVDSLISNDNPIVKQELEKKIESLENQIKATKGQRNKMEVSEEEIQLFVKFAGYLVEHLDELLLDSTNPYQQQALFGLVFDKPPTYTEVVNRTPKLSLVFELSDDYSRDKSRVVWLAE
jgi:hypothetical protein